MRDLFMLTLLLVVFLAWIIAEWRAQRWLRIGLGLLCMILLAMGIYIVIDSTNRQFFLYSDGLRQIDAILQQGETERARRVIGIYRTTLTETGNHKAALASMIIALRESGDSDDREHQK
jgi:hypothetical protein